MSKRTTTTRVEGCRVSSLYVHEVHRAAAEDGHAPAERLLDEYATKRGRVVVPWTDEECIRELESLAAVWSGGASDYDPDFRWVSREARYVADQIRAHRKEQQFKDERARWQEVSRRVYTRPHDVAECDCATCGAIRAGFEVQS
jgi:hypothetical protein